MFSEMSNEVLTSVASDESREYIANGVNVHKNFRANSWRPLASSVTIGGRLSA